MRNTTPYSPAGTKPLLSIVIVNWNTEIQLRECLASVVNNNESIPTEVIVVDNCSADRSCEMCGSEFPNVKLIINECNVGFARANNTAIRASSGDFIMLLNPDTQVRPNTMSRMIEFMRDNPSAGVVGPKIIEPNGEIQGSARKFPSLRTAFLGRTSFLRKIFGSSSVATDEIPCLAHKSDDALEVDWVNGACMFVRKEAIEQTGLLDEKFFMYWEDADWCFRIIKSGWKVFWLPTAEILHLTGESSRQAKIKTIVFFHKSIFYYFSKNINENKSFALNALVWSLVWARCAAKISVALIK